MLSEDIVGVEIDFRFMRGDFINNGAVEVGCETGPRLTALG